MGKVKSDVKFTMIKKKNAILVLKKHVLDWYGIQIITNVSVQPKKTNTIVTSPTSQSIGLINKILDTLGNR